MPMEVEEHGARFDEKEVFRIPYSSKYNSSGGAFKYQDELKNETKHTLQNSSHIHALNSSTNTKHFSSPDLSSQFNSVKKIKKKTVICINNPSLWAESNPSEVNRGHGVVNVRKRLRKGKAIRWSQKK